MRGLAALLGLLWASAVHAETYPATARQGGDTFELRQGEVFLELIYENAGEQSSGGGVDWLELNGVQVMVHVTVSQAETLTVRVPDPGLFPEIEEIEVEDGERVVVRIMPVLF